MIKYLHHNTSFKITTSDIVNTNLRSKVEKALLDLFKGFILSNKEESFSFIFTDNIESFVDESKLVRIENIKVSDTQIILIDSELNILIQKNDMSKVYVNISNKETIKSSLRFLDKTFKNNIELQITTFYYRVFLLFSQLWNVDNNISYLHSSSISINNEAVIFTADSGVGKSSLLLRLSQEEEYQFIADDLSIISEASLVYYQGRCLSVKPYHLKFFNFLDSVINNEMPKWQKVQWRLLNNNRLTFRIAPNKLFKKISKVSKIKRVIHLCNHSDDKFIIQNISHNELVKYTVPIIINELFLANYKLNLISSLPDSGFMNSSELYEKVSRIYQKAFEDTELLLVLVPFMSDPNKLFEFLKSEGCLD